MLGAYWKIYLNLHEYLICYKCQDGILIEDDGNMKSLSRKSELETWKERKFDELGCAPSFRPEGGGRGWGRGLGFKAVTEVVEI